MTQGETTCSNCGSQQLVDIPQASGLFAQTCVYCGSVAALVEGVAKATEEIRIGSQAYYLTGETLTGDFCEIRFALRESTRRKMPVCIKRPFSADDNELMQKEALVLRTLNHKSLPMFVDTCTMEDGRVANVTKRIDGFTIEEVRQRMPAGFPPEYSLAVAERLLSVVGYLHTKNVLHGAIQPTNVILTPEDHNAVLIDYLMAVTKANEPGSKYTGVGQFSAPEVTKDAKPHPASDLFSLGLTLIYLMGGDTAKPELPFGIDPKVETFIMGLLAVDPKQRMNDAWEAYHRLCDIRTEVCGPKGSFTPWPID